MPSVVWHLFVGLYRDRLVTGLRPPELCICSFNALVFLSCWAGLGCAVLYSYSERGRLVLVCG